MFVVIVTGPYTDKVEHTLGPYNTKREAKIVEDEVRQVMHPDADVQIAPCTTLAQFQQWVKDND